MFFIPEPKPAAKVRLFCFPYAGGSIKTFIPWTNLLPNEIELAILEAPGKGRRAFEDPFTSIDKLVSEVIQDIQILNQKPAVFFGHSLGAKVAFECCVKLSESKLTLPEYLFLSACGSPNTKLIDPKSHQLSDDEFINSLEFLNGTPREVLANRELMEILLPGLRADFRIAETYLRKVQKPLKLPTTVFWGTGDTIHFSAIENWRPFFTPEPEFVSIKGGHFFVDSDPEQVIRTILKQLERMWNVSSNAA